MSEYSATLNRINDKLLDLMHTVDVLRESAMSPDPGHVRTFRRVEMLLDEAMDVVRGLED